MSAIEVNFDGLVGPTHHYAGLSLGNVASMRHRGKIARPRQAALQGLAKMKLLAELGVPQGILPPHERPCLTTLRALGFAGRDDAAVLRAAWRVAPELVAACSSASSMWVANAATVTPSMDSGDGRVHLTPANLTAKFHRSIEPAQTARTLRAIFRDETHFVVHDPIPGGQAWGDEGAANHTRLAPSLGSRGLHVFVYGHHAGRRARGGVAPRKFASRQAFEASAAIARRHGLTERNAVFLRQNPRAIDAGVFHHDVIAVGHQQVWFGHEEALVNSRAALSEIQRAYRRLQGGRELEVITVPARAVSLSQAVRSYLFNSQLVSRPQGRMALIVPAECQRMPAIRHYLAELQAEATTSIREIYEVDLRESMSNGGGPACLRLRVVLNSAEWGAVAPGVKWTPQLQAALTRWIERHYRETLSATDLADPALLEEGRRALDELTQLLRLGSLYPFQQV